MLDGDLNGCVGKHPQGYEGVHCGHDGDAYRARNVEGKNNA